MRHLFNKFVRKAITSILSKKLYLPFLLLSISPFLYLLTNLDKIPQYDWNYFNSHTLLIREFFFNLKFPFIDLHVCGGVDTFANPQNSLFSPLSLLTVLYNPYHINLASLIVCAFFCYHYMVKLVTVSRVESYLIATIFTLSPFFSLHFAEGHIPFRSFYFIPMLFYFLKKEINLKVLFKLIILLVFFLLDGGIYMLFFSLFLLMFYLPLSLSKVQCKMDGKKRYLLYMAFGAFLVSMAKILPVLLLHSEREFLNEPISYDLIHIKTALFDIFQSNGKQFYDFTYRTHEYAHYIGFALTALFIIGILKRKWDQNLLMIALTGWISFGVGGIVNPWTLYKLIPFFNQAHIQSRFLVFFFFFLLLYISKVPLKRNLKILFLSVALLEMLFMNFYNYKTLIARDTLNDSHYTFKDITNAEVYARIIHKPIVYGSERPSYLCYEPAQQEFRHRYKSLIIPEDQGHKVSTNYSSLVIDFNEEVHQSFVVNYKWLLGWECDDCSVVNNEGLIEVTPSEPSKSFIISYDPLYYPLIFVSYVLGILFLIYTWRKIKDV